MRRIGLLVFIAGVAVALALLERERRRPPGSSTRTSPSATTPVAATPVAATPAPIAAAPSMSSPEVSPAAPPAAGASGDAYVPPAASPTVSPSAPAAAAPQAAPAHVAYVADAKLLLIGADGKLEFCDPATGQRRAVGVSLGQIEALAVSPDGRMLAAVDMAGKIMLTETAGYSLANVVATGMAGARGVAIGADGRTIAIAGAGVAVWDLVDRRAKIKLLGNEPCNAVAFSTDGRTLAVGTSTGVSLWETTFWQKQANLAGGGAAVVRFWPARSAVVAADAAGNLRVYDLATRQLQASLAAAAALSDVAPSPDGHSIVTSGAGGVTIWDSSTRASRKLP